MSAKPYLWLLLAASATSPLFAQETANPGTGRTPQEEYQRGYAATPMPNQASINAAGAPGTAALNSQVAAATQASNQANEAALAEGAAAQAQYDADRQAYMDALIQHDAAVNRTDRRYVRQQRAYADAMRAWRVQAYACQQGRKSACNAPPPDPSAFY